MRIRLSSMLVCALLSVSPYSDRGLADEQPSSTVLDPHILDHNSAVKGGAKAKNESRSGLVPIAGSNPPVTYGLSHNVYQINVCSTYNSQDQIPDNDTIEFTTYKIYAGPKRLVGVEDILLSLDYSEWAIQQTIIAKGKAPVLHNVDVGCEDSLRWSKRKTENDLIRVVDDTDRKISGYARPFWQSHYGYQKFVKYVECDSEWNERCESEHDASVSLEELDFLFDPSTMQVCNVVFSDSHFGGWEASYTLDPIIKDRTESFPKGYVTGYYYRVKANGSHDPLNQIGARVKLSNIGLTYVLRTSSAENLAALHCDPKRIGRAQNRSVGSHLAPMQCVDTDDVGYYCGETPRNGRYNPGGFRIWDF